MHTSTTDLYESHKPSGSSDQLPGCSWQGFQRWLWWTQEWCRSRRDLKCTTGDFRHTQNATHVISVPTMLTVHQHRQGAGAKHAKQIPTSHMYATLSHQKGLNPFTTDCPKGCLKCIVVSPFGTSITNPMTYFTWGLWNAYRRDLFCP